MFFCPILSNKYVISFLFIRQTLPCLTLVQYCFPFYLLNVACVHALPAWMYMPLLECLVPTEALELESQAAIASMRLLNTEDLQEQQVQQGGGGARLESQHLGGRGRQISVSSRSAWATE